MSLYIEPWLLILLIVVVVASIVLVVWLSIRAHRGKVSAGKEELVGRTAVAETALSPRGTVQIEGERWTAIAEDGQIPAEAEVIVTRVDGLRLYVKKA